MLKDEQLRTDSQPQEAELKPCPFCGGKAIRGMFAVWCESCSAATVEDSSASREEIISRWNTRVDLPRAIVDDRDANAKAVALVYEFTDNISPLRLYAKEWLINRITELLSTPRATEGELTVEAALDELRELFPDRCVDLTCSVGIADGRQVTVRLINPDANSTEWGHKPFSAPTLDGVMNRICTWAGVPRG